MVRAMRVIIERSCGGRWFSEMYFRFGGKLVW